MKATKLVLAMLMIVSTTIISCKKYPDGPSLSFRSRTARVSNTWKVDQYLFNGSDQTSTMTSINYSETYDKSGNYSYSSSLGGGSGKWVFQNNDEQIKRSGVSSQSSQDLIILRLKQREFWYYYMDGNDKHEFHLVQK